jgi:hypothetical protein
MPEPSIPTHPSGQLAAPWPLTGEAVTAFVCFVLSDEAQRSSVRGRRQKLPLQGRHVSYGVKAHPRRGSDRPERIYVSVTALQGTGSNNNQACCEVADRWESKLGASRRGRPKRTPRSREFADKVEIVRSMYNSFKLRHPWKENLPEHDLVYEQWCWRFRLFQRWVADRVLSAVAAGVSGKKFAEELAVRAGRGGRNNYDALAGLGHDGLSACLNSWRRQGTQSQLASDQVQRFVKEFFNWVEIQNRKSKPRG